MQLEILSKNDDDIHLLFHNIENSLREVTKNIIHKEIGKDWDISDKLIQEQDFAILLSQRKLDFEKSTGLKETSDLIDFAKFNEIIKIILQNQKIFDKVFHDARTYDFLTKLIHLYKKEFLDVTSDERNKIIAISWFVLKQIEEWNTKDSHKILWYSADLSFDSYRSSDDCLDELENWVSKIKSQAIGDSEFVHPNLRRMYRLDYDEGSIFITSPTTFEVFFQKNPIYSARLRIVSANTELLDLVLSLGGHSYSNVSWVVKDGLNLRSLINVVGLLHDDIKDGFNNDFVSWGGMEYSLTNNPHVLISIMPLKDNEFRIKLSTKDGYFNNGFFYAHKFFSPELIYEIILGLRNKNEIKSMIKSSLRN